VAILLVLWAKDIPVTEAIDNAEINTCIGADKYQWLQEVCTTKGLQMPIILGGPWTIAQVDESLFHHKPKIRNKIIKFMYRRRGRRTQLEIWVLGMVGTSYNPALACS